LLLLLLLLRLLLRFQCLLVLLLLLLLLRLCLLLWLLASCLLLLLLLQGYAAGTTSVSCLMYATTLCGKQTLAQQTPPHNAWKTAALSLSRQPTSHVQRQLR
jgi:hypothetical protein